jgi:hypothetical protein
MPNRKAKDKKERRRKLNEKWTREGRTANQHKKYLAKLEKSGINPNQRRYN